ncbi:MAG: GIY-YIG nuclease family protein [Candidatus Omnitrophota bacterium]
MAEKTLCWVYVLKSLKNGKRYVGFTKLLPERRLKQHNNGSNKWTRENGPFRLIYSESYESPRAARQRERFLKSGVGRKFLDSALFDVTSGSVSAKGGPASGGG